MTGGIPIWWGVLLLCLGGFTACSHWRDAYFDDGVGKITQRDVRKKLGKPHIVEDPLLSDETTWIYRYGLSESDLDPWGVGTLGQGVSDLGNKAAAMIGRGQPGGGPRERVHCVRYVLTFDREAVLRAWKREPCRTVQPKTNFRLAS